MSEKRKAADDSISNLKEKKTKEDWDLIFREELERKRKEEKEEKKEDDQETNKVKLKTFYTQRAAEAPKKSIPYIACFRIEEDVDSNLCFMIPWSELDKWFTEEELEAVNMADTYNDISDKFWSFLTTQMAEDNPFVWLPKHPEWYCIGLMRITGFF